MAKLSTIWKMMKPGDSVLRYLRTIRLMFPVHRVAWVAAASRHGVLRLLREPKTLAEIMAHLDAPAEREKMVWAWLRHGCLLKEIRLDGERYGLRGALARGLADPAEEIVAALAEALVAIHHEGIYGALDHVQTGRSLAQIDHGLVARVSELAAPALLEIVEEYAPAEGECRWLELGCGNGRYIRHACAQNSQLKAVGVDLDPAVAEHAQRTLNEAGLESRARAIAGDLRTVELDERFDRVTMFNLIYYVPTDERAAVIERVASWVDPGGTVLLSSMCQGGTLGANVLDVWFSSLRECGPLPEADAVVQALKAAGLEPEPPRRVLPGEAFFLFVAHRPK
ncbi:MAG: class I SAM-dependent methyltransferase [Myxococcota bacterium]